MFLLKNEETVFGKSHKKFYDIFVGKRLKDQMENTREKLFHIERSDWARSFRDNICKIVDKNGAEFKYKLFYNLLCNNYYPSKWKTDVKIVLKWCCKYTFNKNILS